MAQYETLMVNVEGLIPGKFYRVYTDSNGTVLTIIKDDEDAKFNQIEVNKNDLIIVKQNLQNFGDAILDNQSRINNLEMTEVERIKEFISRVSITKPFINSNIIEIEHHRDVIINVLVMEKILDTFEHKEYREVVADWKEVEELIGGVWIKKVVITLNQPTTGYVVIL